MKIFIDAGHNDRYVDTGATGNGLREQDVTYDVAMMLGDKLSNIGVSVKYSRPHKTDVIGTTLSDSLNKRADMANAWGADLFVSIHCNASVNAGAKGTEVYAYSTSSKGYPLAKAVCDSICKRLGTANRGAKTANYAVLKKTSMPAILIETAFITNASDVALLKNRKDDFAEAIYNAVCEYYGLSVPKKKNLESAKDIVDELSQIIEITEPDKAVKALEKAKNEDSSLYWILYKLVNKVV